MYNIYTGSHRTRKRILAHRLVASVFLGLDLNSDLTVNYIDGNKSNNLPQNLEVVSTKDNIKHAFNTGLSSGKCYRQCVAENSESFGFWSPLLSILLRKRVLTQVMFTMRLQKVLNCMVTLFQKCKS